MWSQDYTVRKVMRARTAVLAFVMAIALMSVAAVADESVADSQYDEHWCYGDIVYFEYGVVGSQAEVTWSIYDEDMNLIDTVHGTSVSFDASGYDVIFVEQLVELHGNSTEKTDRVNLMHVNDELSEGGDGVFTVAFFDEIGGDLMTVAQFMESSVVHAVSGQSPMFIEEMPEAPVLDGRSFLGWFYEDESGQEQAFEPTNPVTSDLEVYAKWTSSGSGDTGNSGGSGGTIVIGGVHIVTFECVQGLTYSVVSTGSSSVSFTVNEVPGFSVDSSSIEVTANGSPLEPVNGTYTVSGINSDVLVSIQGDVISLDNPDEGGIPFWVWIVLIIVIVLAVAVVYWMYIRNQRQ